MNADGVFVNSLLGQNLFCYCWNNSSNHAYSDGQIAFLVALGSAVIGAVTGAACSIACDLIAGEKVDWGSAGKEAAKGAVSAILPGGRVVSSIAMVAMNTADYLWECKTEQKEVEGAVIAWEVVATVAGEMIGAGLEGGAQVANKTVDKVVNEVVGVEIALPPALSAKM